MDGNETLNDATLADSLNAVCYALADTFIHGGHVLMADISVLTTDIIENYLPGQVFNIAVNAGWIVKPDELEPGKGDLLGDFIVDEAYRDSFVGLLADSLSDLREIASKNDEDVGHRKVDLFAAWHTWKGTPQGETVSAFANPQKTVGGRGRELIAEYFRLSDKIFHHFELAQKASLKRKKIDGGNVVGVHVSRIYNGTYVGPVVRQGVAEVLNEKVPCTKEDLVPLKWPEQNRGEIK